eukprot:UN24048
MELNQCHRITENNGFEYYAKFSCDENTPERVVKRSWFNEDGCIYGEESEIRSFVSGECHETIDENEEPIFEKIHFRDAMYWFCRNGTVLHDFRDPVEEYGYELVKVRVNWNLAEDYCFEHYLGGLVIHTHIQRVQCHL